LDVSALDLVQRAKEIWKGQLVDLGGRNTLLHYRDLKVGTLDLGPDSGANDVVVDDLLSSRTVALTDVFGAEVRPDAARRTRTIRAKATENFEERGLRTLFLAWGMATWSGQRSSAMPAAPVLLRQAHIAPRGRAEESFDLSLPGEWEVNPTLLYALGTEFGVTLDGDELLALLDDGGAGAPDPGPVFDTLTKLVAAVPGFSVDRRVVMANFSYAKMAMVADLETDSGALAGSALICAIAGSKAARQALRDRQPSARLDEPDTMPPADEFLVLDADASQSYAINAAVRRADLVIEGPPGTGKSQTIANLIATLAARGQKVLFVAEKRAAIDAVLDRLRKVELSELVLDLHDGAGSKRKLAQDLARSLADASSIVRPELSGLHDGLVRRRRALVAHDDAMHTRRDPWQVSVYEILCRRLGVPEKCQSAVLVDPARLTGPVYEQARHDLREYVNLGGLRLSSASSPWAGALTAGTIATAAQAQLALSASSSLAGHTWPQALERLNYVARQCGLRAPGGVPDWAPALALLDGVASTLATFDQAVFSLPLDQVVTALGPASGSPVARALSSVTNGRYRSARQQLRAVCHPSAKHSPRALLAAATAAADLQGRWRELSTDGGQPRLPDDLAGAEGSYCQLLDELRALSKLAALAGLERLDGGALAVRLRALADDTETLSKLPALTGLRAALCRVGLGPLLEELTTRNPDVGQSVAVLDWVWLNSVLRYIQVSDPRVGAFERAAHDRDVAEFGAADRQHVATGPQRVRRAVAERVTAARDQFPDQSDVVTKQAALTRRHLPVRDLFQAAPDVLCALKPCWAMSPLLVSQLLPMQECFDVVIFDEASQVTPADAVGALARAGRAIVAGDRHQLPPTNFFASGGGADDEEGPDATEAIVRDVESVLDQMTALLPPPIGTRTLSWHYRSRDERLIAFSNAQPTLYDYSLTTFPGARGKDALTHVLVPFRPGRVGEEDSVGDEVAKVVELVTEHAHLRPEESLGVIAMGVKHANRVEEAVRRARRQDDVLDAFVTGEASAQAHRERFFVKNIERVQGDERDAIMLTVGYGKTTDGRLLYHFGPLNNEGGERRLNVAITRARDRMTVVSSFTSADLDPAKLRAEGVLMLGRYLAYAESGGSNLGDVARDKPDLNPFERDVEAQLTLAGLPLVAQWGCSGYWIDYVAKHPTKPGRMVMAIECDGVSYHSSATARDRDRLRQEHLERLGWRFHRIWSAEWSRRREAEVARALEAYKQAVAASDRAVRPRVEEDGQVPSPAPPVLVQPERPPGRRGYMPVPPNRGPISTYSHSELVGLVRWIESDTLLRTEEELLDEAVHCLGYHRRGTSIVAALQAAVSEVRRCP
jgi:very-short-patch-repair endonuclease